jgi:phospholipid/cholesterol/gamma-HCH transport system ATP-binding protein
VVVTHELASIFMIADDSIFLDADTKTMRVQGHPRELLKYSTDAKLRAFLTRGEFSGEAATQNP